MEEILRSLKSKKINKEVKLDLVYLLEKIYETEYKSKDLLTRKQFNKLIDKTKEYVKKTQK